MKTEDAHWLDKYIQQEKDMYGEDYEKIQKMKNDAVLAEAKYHPDDLERRADRMSGSRR